MSTVQLDIIYREPRSRLTTFFRGILSIPHQIVSNLLLQVAQVLAVIQWFIILFTGRRNEGLFKLQSQWLAYAASSMAYYGVMFDRFPPFVTMNGHPAMTYGLTYTAEANRLTNFLRLLWAIPAMIVAFFVLILGVILTVLSWIAIVITGRHPRGMFDTLVKVHRFMTRLNAYLLLLTDVYPKYE